MIPDNETRFGSRNFGGEMEERPRVATGTRARIGPC